MHKNPFHVILLLLCTLILPLDWSSHAFKVYHYEWNCKSDIKIVPWLKLMSVNVNFKILGESSSWRGTRQQSYYDCEWVEVEITPFVMLPFVPFLSG